MGKMIIICLAMSVSIISILTGLSELKTKATEDEITNYFLLAIYLLLFGVIIALL